MYLVRLTRAVGVRAFCLALALLLAGLVFPWVSGPGSALAALSTVSCSGNDLFVSTPGSQNSFGSYRINGTGPNLPQTYAQNGTVTVPGPGAWTNLIVEQADGVGYTLRDTIGSATCPPPGLTAQTITFAQLPAKTFGDAPFTVSASASSGLTVTFSSSTTGVCTVAGTTVTIVAAGSCSILADQAGNGSYSAAPTVTNTFTVNKANQTITFNTLSNRTYGDAPFTVSATASSGLTVSFTATGNCSVAGTTVTITGAGSCAVTAHQAGNANYNAAPDVERSFTIAKASQTITFNPLGDKTFGDAPFAVSASASSGLSVSFAASGNCSVSGTTVTITGAGSCTVTASQGGNANYNAASDVIRSFNIAKASQAITFNALGGKTYGDAPFTVGATASSGLTVSFIAGPAGVCTISGTTVTITGAGDCTVTAQQGGNANYNAAPDVPRSFTVGKASLSVTALNATRPFGTSTIPCTVSFAGFVNGDGPGVVSGSATCTTTATASSPVGPYPLTPALGTLSAANYTFGPFINGTLTIVRASTALSVVRGDTTYGDATATLTATLRRTTDNAPLAGLSIQFTLGGVPVGTAVTDGNGVATLLGVAVTRRNGGSYAGLVGASFAGTTSYEASSGSGPLVVARKIVWVKPQDRTVGLYQPNPPTTPPANCLASATATSACWLELINGSTFVSGESWSALNLSLLRFSYSRNPPTTNAGEYVGKTYRITVIGAVSANYDIRVQQGTLTVVP